MRPAGKRTLPRGFGRWIIAGAAILALGVVLQCLWPNGMPMETGQKQTATTAVSEIHGTGPVRLNELMSSNSGTLMDAGGATPDWIEVMNVSGHAVDLSGYVLARTEHSTNTFTFPSHRLEPGEAVIVFADSTLRSDAGGEYHAPFRLSSQGGTLMLFSPSGTAIDSVNFPALAPDTTYVRQSASEWAVSNQPTPGLSNTAESYQALHEPRTDCPVEITEVVASNTQYAPDANGRFHDYLELHNASSESVDLSGWYLSDSAERPAKWRIPDGFALQPGEYRIVYASGLDKADGNRDACQLRLPNRGRVRRAGRPAGTDCRPRGLRSSAREHRVAQAGRRQLGRGHALSRRGEPMIYGKKALRSERIEAPIFMEAGDVFYSVFLRKARQDETPADSIGQITREPSPCASGRTRSTEWSPSGSRCRRR